MSDDRGALAAAAAQIAQLRQQLTEAQAQADARVQAEQAKTAALVAKFGAMYGEPTADEGIIKGPQPYITSEDQVAHATLEDARVHLVGLRARVDARGAKHLVANADELIPLIQRAAGKPTS
jgi:hypothetical protein